jgi:hypothetical protein
MNEIPAHDPPALLRCPCTFCQYPVKRIRAEKDPGWNPPERVGIWPDCENEYYVHYRNGTLMKRDIAGVNFMARSADL